MLLIKKEFRETSLSVCYSSTPTKTISRERVQTFAVTIFNFVKFSVAFSSRNKSERCSVITL